MTTRGPTYAIHSGSGLLGTLYKLQQTAFDPSLISYHHHPSGAYRPSLPLPPPLSSHRRHQTGRRGGTGAVGSRLLSVRGASARIRSSGWSRVGSFRSGGGPSGGCLPLPFGRHFGAAPPPRGSLECGGLTEPGESPFLDLHRWSVRPAWPGAAPPLVKEVHIWGSTLC